MALTFKLDTQQALDIISGLRGLTEAVKDLSENVGKWQGQQVDATTKGFAALVATFGGDSEEVQQRINQITENLSTSTSVLESAIKQHTEGEE